jgi:hypothetical protein
VTRTQQPWIYSARVDGLFILAVPYAVVAVTLIFRDYFSEPDSMTVVSWAILVMGVDVSHVYSSLYRTYLDRETRERHGTFLFVLPFAVLITCLLVYSAGAWFFWRVMAYLAVFHFARQQYGFMRVYSRYENPSAWMRRLDALAIYTATLYPIVDWHLAGPRNFNWFMKGDFYYLNSEGLRTSLFIGYLTVIAIYLVKEATLLWKSIAATPVPAPAFNLPRNALIAGTFLSWYVGIVYFNSDIAFTAINVLSHGVPYMALVWIWGHKKAHAEGMQTNTQLGRPAITARHRNIFQTRYVALFVGLLLVLAYTEEGLWDVWVWHEKDHAAFFSLFHAALTDIRAGSPWLALIVPVLSVPQITHYIIDGYIWKMRNDAYGWRDITLGHELKGISPRESFK